MNKKHFREQESFLNSLLSLLRKKKDFPKYIDNKLTGVILTLDLEMML